VRDGGKQRPPSRSPSRFLTSITPDHYLSAQTHGTKPIEIAQERANCDHTTTRCQMDHGSANAFKHVPQAHIEKIWLARKKDSRPFPPARSALSRFVCKSMRNW
jgi:hypothetical protein